MRAPTMGDDKVGLKHGAGGRAMRALIRQVCLAGLDVEAGDGIGLAEMDDGAAWRVGDRWLVVTTDSHVVHPIFFPGGDIGRLSVAGTINDLAMMGATEGAALTCAVVIEEGFARADLERIYASIRDTCRESGARIVTGDTKVMGRGELDGILLNTTGVAFCTRVVGDAGLRPGDVIIVSGSMGDHGMAIMAARHAFALEGDLRSDVAPVNGLVRAALDAGGEHIVALKDPTRGGLSSALHEMAEKSGVGILLEELNVPVRPAVRAAADLLGIDPLQVANEGKAIIGVRAEAASSVLDAVRRHPLGADAVIAGRCLDEHRGAVILDTGMGRRMLPEPEGELLPRIC